MFRKSHLILKFLILTFAVLIVWISSDIVLRHGLIALGEMKSGTRLEIGTLKSNLEKGELHVENVRFSNPENPSQVYADIDSADMRISIGNLSRRRYLVKEGVIRGIRIKSENALGAENSMFDDLSRRFQDEISGGASNFISLDAAIAILSKPSKEAAGEIVKDYEIVKTSNRLVNEWTEEANRTRANARNIETRIRNLGNVVDRVKQEGKLLQGTREFLAELEAIDKESDGLKASISGLKSKTVSDKAELDEAVRNDRVKLDNLRVPKLDPAEVTENLLGNEIRERLAEIFAIIEQAKSTTDVEESPLYDDLGLGFGKERMRGRDVFFAGKRGRVDFFVRDLLLEGDISFADSRFAFMGMLKNVNNRPELFDTPMYLHFALSGMRIDEERLAVFATEITGIEALLSKSHELERPRSPDVPTDVPPDIYISLVIDRTGNVPHDRIIAVCPSYPVPARKLGKEGSFALDISPGNARIALIIDQRGDEISGEVRFLLSPVSLVPHILETRENAGLKSILESGLSGIDSLDVAVDIGGTLDKPSVRFRSDLGNRLSVQWEKVLQDQWQSTSGELISQLNGRYLESLRFSENVVNEQLQPILDSMQSSRNAIEKQLIPGTDKLPNVEIPGLKIPDEDKIREGLRKIFR